MFPVLYKLDKSNRVRYWEVKVDGHIYYTRAGLLKTRDSHQWKPHKRSAQYAPDHGSHKTPEQVAYADAKSAWHNKFRNDAMTTNLDELGNPSKRVYPVPIPPVLAMKYTELSKRHSNYQKYIAAGKKPTKTMYCFPDKEYMVQYKFDGERTTASWAQEQSNEGTLGDPSVRLFSRLRNEIPHLEHIKSTLTKIYKTFGEKNPQIYGYHFDGEIIDPSSGNRNKMRSIISRIKEKHPDNEKITYHVFDMITTPSMPFSKRYEILKSIMSKVNSKFIKLVPIIGSAKLGSQSIEEHLALSVQEGYEGIVMRDPDMLYPIGSIRINEMVKYKKGMEKDYVIVSAYPATDGHEGLIMFMIRDPTAEHIKPFACTPAMSHSDRRECWELYQKDPTQFIGKVVTVMMKELDPITGVPVEGRIVKIRDESDMTEQELLRDTSK